MTNKEKIEEAITLYGPTVTVSAMMYVSTLTIRSLGLNRVSPEEISEFLLVSVMDTLERHGEQMAKDMEEPLPQFPIEGVK